MNELSLHTNLDLDTPYHSWLALVQTHPHMVKDILSRLPQADEEDQLNRTLAIFQWLHEDLRTIEVWSKWFKSEDAAHLKAWKVTLPESMDAQAIEKAIADASPPRCRVFKGIVPWFERLEALTQDWVEHHPGGVRIIAQFRLNTDEVWMTQSWDCDVTKQVLEHFNFSEIDCWLKQDCWKDEFFFDTCKSSFPRELQDFIEDENQVLHVDFVIASPTPAEYRRRMEKRIQQGTMNEHALSREIRRFRL